MNKAILFFISFFLLQACSQTKESYLEDNRFDLSSEDFEFPQNDFNVIGFGGYHGSAKIELVEIDLLKSLTAKGQIKYYLPEVDLSTAYFYNEFLKSGDTVLLKKLVAYNGYHTSQERTIEFYNKWKDLKQLNDGLPESKKLEVLGAEWIRNYTFVSRHVLTFFDIQYDELPQPIQDLQELVELDTTYYFLGDESIAQQILKSVVADYKEKKETYQSQLNDVPLFEHLLKGIEVSFEPKPEREKLVFENFVSLAKLKNFSDHKPFMRIGFAHLEKSREGEKGFPYLFTRFIENEIYPREKVISIIAYYTDSEVVWNEQYDENGDYSGYTTEAGFGIGDYEKEYFRGIQRLKDAKISDRTLFRLNQKDSPYLINEPDLIEVIMTDDPSNSEAVKGMSTLDFLDYALLISDSRASVPIYELK